MRERNWFRLATRVFLPVCLLAVTVGEMQSQAPPNGLVVQGGTLIDVQRGTLVPNSMIVVQGDRITRVGTVGQTAAPAGAQPSGNGSTSRAYASCRACTRACGRYEPAKGRVARPRARG